MQGTSAGPPAENAFTALQIISLVIGILGIGVRWVVLRRKTPPQGLGLKGAINALYAAAGLPAGILLLGAAFDSRLIVLLTDLHLALFAAGIAVISVAWSGLFD
jgi:hypothetical protein